MSPTQVAAEPNSARHTPRNADTTPPSDKPTSVTVIPQHPGAGRNGTGCAKPAGPTNTIGVPAIDLPEPHLTRSPMNPVAP
jgi:hypothetical protein